MPEDLASLRVALQAELAHAHDTNSVATLTRAIDAIEAAITAAAIAKAASTAAAAQAPIAALQAQLDQLKLAYHSGLRAASYDGKRVEYASGDEMRAAIASLEAAIGKSNQVRTIAVRSNNRGW